MNSFPVAQGVSYGRVSTFDQAFNKDGTRIEDASPAVQKIRCEQFIKTINDRPNKKYNYILKDHFSDDGFSGKNFNRPNFKKLLAMIKNEEIKFVVATELSRISRNTQDFLEFVSLCEKHKVDVFIIGFDLDTSSPMGKVFLTLLVALAQFERETTSERVKNNAKSRLLTDGKINGASEALGLDKDPNRRGHFIINENEVKTLTEILNIFLLTSSKIETLRELKRRDIKWKRNEEFTKHKLYSLFNSVKDRYRGKWPIDKKNGVLDQFIELPHGPLIDEALLDKVEEKLNEVAVRKRKPGKDYLYLLTSLLIYEDGSKFTGQPAKNRQYRYYYNSKNKIRIHCDEIDDLVFKRLSEYLANHELLKKLIAEAISKRNEKLPQVKEKLKLAQESFSNLIERENQLSSKLNFTESKDEEVINQWLKDQILTIKSQKESAQFELERLGAIQDELLRPVPIEHIQKYLIQFLGKKNDQRHHKRTLVENIFEKIVIKGSNEIELHFYDDFFSGKTNSGSYLGKKKATSLTCGLNGGSTGT